MDGLLLIQFVSMILTFFIGLMLALSRVHISTIVNRYETSRWMMVCSMLIYSIHYLLQILFGFRASGDDVGAAVNILFYAPVAYLLSFSIVNLSSGSRYLKRHIIFSIISYALIVATFIIGLYFQRSLHLGSFLYAMGAEFFVSIVFAVFDPFKESRRIRSELESNTAGDLGIYNNFMLTGTLLLLITSLLSPAMIFFRPLLFVIGPIFLLILFIYSLNFVCLGFGLRPVADVLDSQENNSPDSEGKDREEDALQGMDIASIKESLDAWVAKGSFSNPDISLAKLAHSIGVPAQMLSRYIGTCYGVTFRVWLSKIRIEEAKRILISNPEATIEFVAEECGFASRSYFQNLFKAETGFTPREWRIKMYGS